MTFNWCQVGVGAERAATLTVLNSIFFDMQGAAINALGSVNVANSLFNGYTVGVSTSGVSVVTSNTFFGNGNNSVAAIYVDGGNPLANASVMNNSISSSGIGVYGHGAVGTNTFSGNREPFAGGPTSMNNNACSNGVC